LNSPFAGRQHSGEDAAFRAGRRAARMRRGMFILPSLFTAGGIGAGYFAITQTLDSLTAVGNDGGASHLDWAAKAICFAIPFDALDGRIARMTNTTSDFGKELDSLADAITFGVAPCLLAWVWGFHSLPEAMNPQLRQTMLQIGSFVCFLYLLCGVSRLARFNISHDPQPRNPGRMDRKYFVGMPIPAGAGVVASVIHCELGAPIDQLRWSAVWIALIAFTSFLMVSSWRFWSAKELNVSEKQPVRGVLLIVVLLLVVVWESQYALIAIALAYLVSGVVARLAYSWGRRLG